MRKVSPDAWWNIGISVWYVIALKSRPITDRIDIQANQSVLVFLKRASLQQVPDFTKSKVFLWKPEFSSESMSSGISAATVLTTDDSDTGVHMWNTSSAVTDTWHALPHSQDATRVLELSDSSLFSLCKTKVDSKIDQNLLN